jgi:hypothetical protein
MRIFGYILLTLGFLGIVVWFADSIVPLPRSIAVENFQKYSQTQMYSGSQVSAAIGSVLDQYKQNDLGVILPTALMLSGGVLLDFAGRRNKRRLDDKPSG